MSSEPGCWSVKASNDVTMSSRAAAFDTLASPAAPGISTLAWVARIRQSSPASFTHCSTASPSVVVAPSSGLSQAITE